MMPDSPGCSIDGCNRGHHAKRLCRVHYQRRRLTGDALGAGPLEGCDAGEVCKVEGCDRPWVARRLCQSHYQRVRRYGSIDRPRKSHCLRGHARTPENVAPRGGCRQCANNAIHIRRCIIRQGDMDIDVDVLGDQVGWVCQLCGQPVDRWRTGRDQMSKSVDHIHPLKPRDGSPPGTHTWDNVQLAHRRCNSVKNNQVVSAVCS